MKIGLIGTGLMGYPMAEKILDNNFALSVFNRTKSKAEPLKSKGASVIDNPVQIFEQSEIIILMLSQYSAIEDILNAKNIKEKMYGKCIIQMSTISPLESQKIESLCIKNNCTYLEAPVLGSINEVINGKLLVLVGGDENLYQKYLPVFKIFGSNIFYIGIVGKASALKLALNQLIVSLTAAFSVSHSYIKKNEIDSELFMDIVRKSALYAPTFDKKFANYENQNFDKTNFPLQLMLKDVRLVKDEADRFEIDSGLLQAVELIIRKAIKKGFEDKDYSSLYMGIYDK